MKARTCPGQSKYCLLSAETRTELCPFSLNPRGGQGSTDPKYGSGLESIPSEPEWLMAGKPNTINPNIDPPAYAQ